MPTNPIPLSDKQFGWWAVPILREISRATTTDPT
jgi:hypothetical protein